MPIKVGNNGQDFNVAKVADAIEFVRQINQQGLANVRVLNNSYGLNCQVKECRNPPVGCSPEPLEEAVKQTEGLHLLFVASAGKGDNNNDCVLHYPSSYLFPNIIAVAASDGNDKLAYAVSNYGPQRVHIAAPGIGICTTAMNNRYVYGEGTSLSTAFASGAAALLFTKCKHGPPEVMKNLLESTDPVGFELDRFGLDKTIAHGRLNVLRAMQKCGT